MIKSYRDLEVWQTSVSLVEAIYKMTAQYSRDEIFGMTAQMRRASVSISANIAEGYGRETTQSFIQFLRIAQGSLKELETHIIISERVALMTQDAAQELLATCDRVARMLRNLIRSLEQKTQKLPS